MLRLVLLSAAAVLFCATGAQAHGYHGDCRVGSSCRSPITAPPGVAITARKPITGRIATTITVDGSAARRAGRFRTAGVCLTGDIRRDT